jgi:hypothetical protein
LSRPVEASPLSLPHGKRRSASPPAEGSRLRHWLRSSRDKGAHLGRGEPLSRYTLGYVFFSPETSLRLLGASRVCRSAYTCGYLPVTISLLSGPAVPPARERLGPMSCGEGFRRAKPPSPLGPGELKAALQKGEKRKATRPAMGAGANRMGMVRRPALPSSYAAPASVASAERHSRSAHIARIGRGKDRVLRITSPPYASNFLENAVRAKLGTAQDQRHRQGKSQAALGRGRYRGRPA